MWPVGCFEGNLTICAAFGFRRIQWEGSTRFWRDKDKRQKEVIKWAMAMFIFLIIMRFGLFNL